MKILILSKLQKAILNEVLDDYLERLQEDYVNAEQTFCDEDLETYRDYLNIAFKNIRTLKYKLMSRGYRFKYKLRKVWNNEPTKEAINAGTTRISKTRF